MKVNNKNKHYLKILIFLLSGFIIGYFSKNQATNANTFDIYYISQDELIQLEHERIRNQNISNQQLFLGKLDEAIRLIDQIANEKSSIQNRVVFSHGTVSGNKVKSISGEVHKELIAKLEIKKNNESHNKYSSKDYGLYHLHEFSF